jgi:hypothetical protein
MRLCITCGNELAPPGQVRCEDCQGEWERSQAATTSEKAPRTPEHTTDDTPAIW